MSKLLPSDDHGCLITEVVVPGFHWEDHKFLNKEEFAKMEGMTDGKKGWEDVKKELDQYVKA